MEQLDLEAVKKLINSRNGKALMALLQKDGGAAFQNAAAAAGSGDYGKARQILEPLLNGTNARDLAEKLGEKYG